MQNKKLVLVGGASGVGKTSVIQEISMKNIKVKTQRLEDNLLENLMNSDINVLNFHYAINDANFPHIHGEKPTQEEMDSLYRLRIDPKDIELIAKKRDLLLVYLHADSHKIFEGIQKKSRDLCIPPRIDSLYYLDREQEEECLMWKKFYDIAYKVNESTKKYCFDITDRNFKRIAMEISKFLS